MDRVDALRRGWPGGDRLQYGGAFHQALALTRKNALFAGTGRGGEHWAIIASLVETCKLNGVEPQSYFADVIARIVDGHPQSRIDDLLPWTYPTIPGFKAAA